MEEEILLLIECYRIFKKRFIYIFLAVFFSLVGTYAYVKSSTKIYQSTSVIWPLGGGGSINPMLAQLASLSGSNLGMQGKSSVDISVLLKSRSLAEIVSAKLDLTKHYFKKSWDNNTNQWKKDLKEIPTNRDGALTLLNNVTIVKDLKNGASIVLNVEDEDPNLAVLINKTYLTELRTYLNENTFTETKRQQLFIEKQLINNNKELLESGKELNALYKGNSASAVFSIDVNSALHDNGDPQVSTLALDDRVKELQKQNEKLDEKSKSNLIEQVPKQLYLEYLLQKKQVLASLNTLLSQQYSSVKMQTAKEDISFSIIDEAIVPKVPIKPKMISSLVMALIVSLFFSLVTVFSIEYLQKLKEKNVITSGPTGSSQTYAAAPTDSHNFAIGGHSTP